MPNPFFSAAVLCTLIATSALAAAVLAYSRINTRTRQTFPHANIPPISRFHRSNERLAVSLYRRAFPHSRLIGIYHALLGIAAVAFLFALLSLFLAFAR